LTGLPFSAPDFVARQASSGLISRRDWPPAAASASRTRSWAIGWAAMAAA